MTSQPQQSCIVRLGTLWRNKSCRAHSQTRIYEQSYIRIHISLANILTAIAGRCLMTAMFKTLPLAIFLGARLVEGAPQKYNDIVSCLDSSGVPQDYPGSSDFTQDAIPYNLQLNFTPIALAVPSTVPQVQAAVVCASKVGVKVNPKSGGYSYASHSLGGEDGHLVIDLKYFRETKVDPSDNYSAVIGPGARLGNIALDLFNQSGRAMAHGICPG